MRRTLGFVVGSVVALGVAGAALAATLLAVDDFNDGEKPNALSEVWIVREHHPAVAHAAKVLRRKEAQRGGLRAAANRSSIAPRTDRLRGILDDRNRAAVRNGLDRVHIRHLPEKVDRHDGSRARRDRGVQARGVHGIGAGIDVDEHGARSEAGDRRDSCDERVR